VKLSEVAATLVGLARVPVRIERDPALVRSADVPYMVGDPGAIGRDTGWSATIPLAQTIAEVLDAWRAAPGMPAR
jgi:GDP-4-dehydro-6-deoxy-D-mannose reductase